jgi:carbonic anhydrase/SulP family sulfate permease
MASSPSALSFKHLSKDFPAGLVVFLVALPLCLGIALASNAPLFSGIVTGIVGGLVVGFISGSRTSVSGPAAGLTAVVAAQIATLGSFEAFLIAVIIAGLIQVALGIAKAGFISAFFPNSVIRGLLAAIGVILILKQIPHVVGHDPDPVGEMSFQQADNENTFSELGETLFDIHPGAAAVGAFSLLLLIFWDRTKLSKLKIPAPLVVVVLGVVISIIFRRLGSPWAIEPSHLVQVPMLTDEGGWGNFLISPDFSQLTNPAVYLAAVTIAIVASLETLLNIEAVDKLDPERRSTPANRELLAQGVGNVTAGLLGGLPMTSVIIRSSVNVQFGRPRRHPAGHRLQTRQSQARQAHVGGGTHPVPAFRDHRRRHRAHRPARRDPDRTWGRHPLHPPQQFPPASQARDGKARQRRCPAYRTRQPGAGAHARGSPTGRPYFDRCLQHGLH